TEVNWDTYLAQHALAPELPKTLAFLGSIYTRQVYWKDDKKDKDDDTKNWNEKTINKDKLWIYNCIDACVTMEVSIAQKKEFQDKGDQYLSNKKKVFYFEMD